MKSFRLFLFGFESALVIYETAGKAQGVIENISKSCPFEMELDFDSSVTAGSE